MTAHRDIEPLLAHASWVRNLALQLCADVHAAEDAAQDTLAAALRQPPRDPERARGFLARTLHNVLAMSGRSERRRARRERLAALPADATAVDAGELVARAELHRQLVVEVLALPEASRELVLRHYFEGDDVATLARRAGISPDAVRAQLRRAREKLRAALERDGGEPARAFGLLVAASRPEAWGTASAASAGLAATVASAGVLTIMKLKVLLGAAAAIAALWFLLPWPAPTRPGGVAKAPADPAPVATADVARSGVVDADVTPVTRTEAPAVPTTFALQGRLVGLHPDVRWTTSLTARATGSSADGRHEHDDHIAVAADGTFTVTLPLWFRRGEPVELRLQGRDPFYLPADARFRPALHSREEPITVQVEPASVVTGKVVDPHGAGVPAARVAAFVPPDEARTRRVTGDTFLRCSTNTDADGNYRLQVPAAAPLLLLALPMHEASLSGNRLVAEGGAISDSNVHRDDLLPASARVATRWGKVTEVPELRLVAPAYVTGSLTTGEGAPVAGVEMIWIHNAADGPPLYDRTLGNLMTWTDGSTGRIALTKTDRNGRFRLPATPGKSGVCYPRDAQGRMEPMVEMVTATPPTEVAFHLEGGIAVVRVLCGGLPVPGVAVTTDSIGDRLTPYDRKRQTDASGEVRLLRSKRSNQQVDIQRPGSEVMHVAIPDVASATAPFVVELPPLPTAPVRLDFEAGFRVRQVELTWSRLDAKVAPLHLNLFRNDGDGPFRLEVPPGRYELVITAPVRAERRDTFLLETRHEVEVPLNGCARKLPIVHGGRIQITATDREGRYVAGGVTLTGSPGRFEWSLREAEDSQNLPVGNYRLRIESWGKTIHQDTVEVRTCEVTDVRVRLP